MKTTQKPLIELWNNYNFFAFIVRDSGGFVFTNQVGGTYCGHPRIEGVLIPLPDFWLSYDQTSVSAREGALDDYAGVYEEDRVRRFLEANDYLSTQFRPCTREELGEVTEENRPALYEAWVPVMCLARNEPALRTVAGRLGVLTWSNSD